MKTHSYIDYVISTLHGVIEEINETDILKLANDLIAETPYWSKYRNASPASVSTEHKGHIEAINKRIQKISDVEKYLSDLKIYPCTNEDKIKKTKWRIVDLIAEIEPVYWTFNIKVCAHCKKMFDPSIHLGSILAECYKHISRPIKHGTELMEANRPETIENQKQETDSPVI